MNPNNQIFRPKVRDLPEIDIERPSLICTPKSADSLPGAYKNRYGIVYEDEHILIINKPSGILVVPTPKGETNTLTDLLNQELDRRGVLANAYPCHRIDRETSGLIIYAKGKAVQQIMMEQFKAHLVKKTYIAFVHGIVRKNSDTLQGNVYSEKKRKTELMITKYRVIERKKYFTIVEVQPVTGRTNQIRIHFKSIGHSLVGESVYAFRKDFKLRFKRVALHAKALEFSHPISGKRMNFNLPLPEDMRKFTK
ncbi:MAG: RluA family pseudouridine synthase [Candidatus Omnitrophica bacterium]|nr:RluA family pseudouridine synthase [Candidatus Omnitrophota bacterium]